MRAHLLIVAVSGLSLAAAVAAEPAKAPVRKAEQPVGQEVNVVIASAEDVRAPAAGEQQAAAPAKRERRARVTTCRCGDQTPNN